MEKHDYSHNNLHIMDVTDGISFESTEIMDKSDNLNIISVNLDEDSNSGRGSSVKSRNFSSRPQSSSAKKLMSRMSSGSKHVTVSVPFQGINVQTGTSLLSERLKEQQDFWVSTKPQSKASPEKSMFNHSGLAHCFKSSPQNLSRNMKPGL